MYVTFSAWSCGSVLFVRHAERRSIIPRATGGGAAGCIGAGGCTTCTGTGIGAGARNGTGNGVGIGAGTDACMGTNTGGGGTGTSSSSSTKASKLPISSTRTGTSGAPGKECRLTELRARFRRQKPSPRLGPRPELGTSSEVLLVFFSSLAKRRSLARAPPLARVTEHLDGTSRMSVRHPHGSSARLHGASRSIVASTPAPPAAHLPKSSRRLAVLRAVPQIHARDDADGRSG